jgi:hypothetical protein
MPVTKTQAAKLVGYLFILTMLTVCIVTLTAFTLELSGAAHFLTTKLFPSYYKFMPLHKTNYYGSPRQKDPYSMFYTQYLHPYYLFSAPWLQKDREAANNDIVSVNEDGFRYNPSFEAANHATGLFLGASVAFGQYATSNNMTIAAQLSRLGGVKFINLNAPSWNSHQELVALLKTTVRYIVSVSFSSNDVRADCSKITEYPDDAPENFDKLAALVNDIRGERQRTPLISQFKAYLANYFLDTSILYTNIKWWYGGQPAIFLGQQVAAEVMGDDACQSRVANGTLLNQQNMRLISEARGARHILVIQPQYSLHTTAKTEFKSRTQSGVEFIRGVIAKIMNSEFCKRDCLDLSTVFDRTAEGATIVKESKEAVYSQKAFFDEVHLTDDGNRVVSQAIAAFLQSRPAP